MIPILSGPLIRPPEEGWLVPRNTAVIPLMMVVMIQLYPMLLEAMPGDRMADIYQALHASYVSRGAFCMPVMPGDHLADIYQALHASYVPRGAFCTSMTLVSCYILP